MGVNIWSAETCTEKFKAFAKESFVRRWLVAVPLLGWGISYLYDSYYQEEPLQNALKNAFSREQGHLFDEPRILVGPTDHHNPVQRFCLQDIKIGVTAVNAVTNQTTIVSNYNRKNDDGESTLPVLPVY